MKRHLIWILVGFAVQITDAQQSEVGRFRIEGVVLDSETGRGLESVQVQADAGSDVVSTDTEGRFVLRLEGPGRYRLVPSLNGFVSSRLQFSSEPGTWVQVSPSEPSEAVELKMSRWAVITGTVLDTNGKPLPGTLSNVSLLRLTYDELGNRRLLPAPIPYPEPRATAIRMDDRGRYRFYGVPPGDYYIRVGGSIATRPTTYYPGVTDDEKATTVHVTSGDEIDLSTIVVLTYRTVHLKLRLTGGPEQSPLTVVRFARGGSQVGDFVFTPASANGQTEVDIPVATSEKYYVLPQWIGPGPDLIYGSSEITVGSADMEQTISMKRGYRMTGRISSSDESVVSSAKCLLRSVAMFAEKPGQSGCIGSQYSDGTYWLDIDGIPSDSYVDSATASGRDILTQPLLLNSDTELDIRISTGGGILNGSVQDATGSGLSQATIVLIPQDGLRNARLLYKGTVTDTKGRYEMRGIKPGEYQAFVWCQLEGAPYLNDQFMKGYEDQGMPVRIESKATSHLDISGCN